MKNRKLWIVSIGFVGLNYFLMVLDMPNFLIPTLFILAGLVLSDMLFGKLLGNEVMKTNIRVFWASTFTMLLILEIVIRMTGLMGTWHEKNFGQYQSLYQVTRTPNTWYHSWPPNTDISMDRSEFQYEKFTNSLGLLGDEFRIEKDSNEFRIIVFGDSFTEGVGAPMDSTWVIAMEEFLDSDSTNIITTYNAGVSGSDPFYAYVLFRDKMKIYQPDLILVAVNSSDITDYFVRGGLERFCEDSTVRYKKPPWIESVYRPCHTCRIFLKYFVRMNDFMIRNKDYRKLEKKSTEEIFKIILKFHQSATESEIGFALILHPQDYEYLYNEFPFQNLAGKARKNGISVIDIRSHFEDNGYNSEETIKSLYWKIDRHHNSKGYHLMGEGVAKKILELGLIKKIN